MSSVDQDQHFIKTTSIFPFADKWILLSKDGRTQKRKKLEQNCGKSILLYMAKKRIFLMRRWKAPTKYTKNWKVKRQDWPQRTGT
eukprot:4699725-Ditylum_brightwellii.AAC.1